MSMVDHALELAAKGWAVLPLRGKLPAIPKAEGGNGFKDASTEPDQVREWWAKYVNANIGLAVPRDLVVVDVDPCHGGEETLTELTARHGRLPRTLTAITGSGGRHLWFWADTDRLEQRGLGAGLDTRIGGRGYVVAPPSIHPETARPYAWVVPAAAIATLPAWVVDRLRPAQRTSGALRDLRLGDGCPHLVAWAADRVARAPEGQRHQTLRNTARLLGGYVATGAVSESDARAALRAASAGWPNRGKSERTIEDGLRHGRGSPLEAS
jgi:Bifunctional DNA primase/polymerase, N-terminal